MKIINLVACSISTTILLGGCFGAENGQKSSNEQNSLDRPEDQFESALTYTGEGYDLPGGGKAEKIAAEHKDEVVKATKDYLKKEYNTDVDVHNMVGNQNGVTVFYESVGDVHFYSTAIVPIDIENETVLSSNVWTLEGEVEKGIETGLFALWRKEEFDQLDSLLEEILQENKNIVGRKLEAIQNVGGNGFMTPYYFVQPLKYEDAFQDAIDLYLKSSDPDTEDIISSINQEINSDDFLISIQFFMKNPEAQPSQEIFEAIKEKVENANQIPPGTYVLSINDHYIHKESSEGYKKNSISLEEFEGIEKDS